MNITKNGITIIVEDAEIVRMALERLSEHNERDVVQFGAVVVPRIGQSWPNQGGVYAGVMRGRDNAPDYHLIVGPEYDGSNEWQHLVDWAKGLTIDGRNDFTLPFRREQALCFANAPELFKQECYWSCEQHASYSHNAWSQHFYYGYQGYWSKDYELRARAVRRLVIQ